MLQPLACLAMSGANVPFPSIYSDDKGCAYYYEDWGVVDILQANEVNWLSTGISGCTPSNIVWSTRNELNIDSVKFNASVA